MWFNCLRHFPPQHCQVETAGRIEPSPRTPRNNLRIHTPTTFQSIQMADWQSSSKCIFVNRHPYVYEEKNQFSRYGLVWPTHSAAQAKQYTIPQNVPIASVFSMFSCYIWLFFIQGHCHVIAKPIARKPIRHSCSFWVPDRGLAKGRNKKMKVKQNSASRYGYAGD